MRNLKLEEDLIKVEEFIDQCSKDFPIADVVEAWEHVKSFVEAKDYAGCKDNLPIITEAMNG